ncbi:MAG TPA: hypothetical protein PKM88_07255, partial [bacterium]|nr:hypothetical protein [bacterium]
MSLVIRIAVFLPQHALVSKSIAFATIYAASIGQTQPTNTRASGVVPGDSTGTAPVVNRSARYQQAPHI